MKKIILVIGNNTPNVRAILEDFEIRKDLFEIEKVDATIKTPRECIDYIEEFVGVAPSDYVLVFAGEHLGMLSHRNVTGVCGVDAKKLINSMEESVGSWGAAGLLGEKAVPKMFNGAILALALEEADNEKINVWLAGATKVES
jgi:hypothetical protein